MSSYRRAPSRPAQRLRPRSRAGSAGWTQCRRTPPVPRAHARRPRPARRAQRAACACRRVAEPVASTGPASTGSRRRRRSAGRAASLCDAAADDVHHLDCCDRTGPARSTHRAPVGERQAVEDAPDHRRRLSGTGWPAARQAAAIRAGMSPGGRKPGRRGRSTERSAGSAAGRQQRAAGRRQARRSQSRSALLQQPQPHHVAQVPDRAVDAGLVGEVGGPALLGQHRRVQLDARPATRCPARCRRSRRRAGTPTTADAVSCEPTATTGTPGRKPACGAAGSSGADAQSPAGAAAGTGRVDAESAAISSARPASGPDVVAAPWWRRWCARRRPRR